MFCLWQSANGISWMMLRAVPSSNHNALSGMAHRSGQLESSIHPGHGITCLTVIMVDRQVFSDVVHHVTSLRTTILDHGQDVILTKPIRKLSKYIFQLINMIN